MNSRAVFFLLLITFPVWILSSCEKKAGTIPKLDLVSLPVQSVQDFNTQYFDSGKLKLTVTGSLMERYDSKEKSYMEFTSGIKVNMYEGKPEAQGSVTAKYAKFTQATNMWELKDSVIVFNNNNGKLETELLFWDQKKDLIYTDRFVKITNQDQITLGSGFESDSKLTTRKIKKVSAIIPLKDEK
jgi:LPS export ABC transporter protein LptC